LLARQEQGTKPAPAEQFDDVTTGGKERRADDPASLGGSFISIISLCDLNICARH
jgi:hypothetical protein